MGYCGGPSILGIVHIIICAILIVVAIVSIFTSAIVSSFIYGIVYGLLVIACGVIGILGTLIKFWIIEAVFIAICVFFIVLGVIGVIICAIEDCGVAAFLTLAIIICFFGLAAVSGFFILKENKRGEPYIGSMGKR